MRQQKIWKNNSTQESKIMNGSFHVSFECQVQICGLDWLSYRITRSTLILNNTLRGKGKEETIVVRNIIYLGISSSVKIKHII